MAELPDLDFGKMVGPLPLGAWVGVVGGGLGLMLYVRRQNASSDGGYTGTANTSDDAVMQYEDVSIPPGVGTGGWTYTPPVSDTGSGSTAPDPDTNETWARRAVNGLIALGYDPSVADSALRKYMEGSQLGASEYALVTIALGKYGAPPVLLPAPIFGPPTAPNPAAGAGKPTTVTKPKPVTKPHVRYYTVLPGQTLSGIAKRHGLTWQAVFNANKKGKKRADGSAGILDDPNKIRPGQKLILPNN